MKKYRFLLLVPIIFLLGSNYASALSCMPRTTQEHIDGAAAVFTGTVLSIRDGFAEFDVMEYWKGDVEKKVAVGGIYTWTGQTPSPYSSSPYFNIGESYLVFAQKVSDPNAVINPPVRLMASIDCGNTKRLTFVTDEEKAILGEGKAPVDQTTYVFTRNMGVGSSGQDVAALQTFLEDRGFLIMRPGITKGYFGILTRNALIKYQQSKNIRPANGYFGPVTRKSLNQNL